MKITQGKASSQLVTKIMEQELYNAVCDRDEIAVKNLLATYPNIDVSWTPSPEYRKTTMLHKAAMLDVPNIVDMLLKHPDTDINAMTTFTVPDTPFSLACCYGCVESVKVLLRDPRLDVNRGYDDLNPEDGVNPLRIAVVNGHLDIIKHWIVSDVALPINPDYDELIEAALVEHSNRLIYRHGYKDIAQLLLDYKSGPQAQQRIRRKFKLQFGLLDAEASDIYALTIFLCDGLLSLVDTVSVNATDTDSVGVESTKEQDNRVSFFNIVSGLPMELQMLICYQAVDVMKDNITSTASEAAFRRLAAKLEG